LVIDLTDGAAKFVEPLPFRRRPLGQKSRHLKKISAENGVAKIRRFSAVFYGVMHSLNKQEFHC
jgi:hypothetical protein